jgi:hypothetical protein
MFGQSVLSKKRANTLEKHGSQELKLTIYPNPASTSFIIENPDTRTTWMAKVVTIDGRVITSKILNSGEPGISVDSKNISNGIYFVILENKFSKITSKLIVEHP